MQRMADGSRSGSCWPCGDALLTFLAWGFSAQSPRGSTAVINAVSVLIIACPCAWAWPRRCRSWSRRAAAPPGRAVPGCGSDRALRKVDTLIVDKTGTLTEGRPAFRDAVPRHGVRPMRCCASRPAWTRAANTRWRGDRSGGATARMALEQVEAFESVTRHRRARRVEGRAWRSAIPADARSARTSRTCSTGRALRDGRRQRDVPRRRRPRSRACSRSPTRSRHRRPKRSPRCAQTACAWSWRPATA